MADDLPAGQTDGDGKTHPAQLLCAPLTGDDVTVREV